MKIIFPDGGRPPAGLTFTGNTRAVHKSLRFSTHQSRISDVRFDQISANART